MRYDNQALQFHCKPSKGWMNDPNGLIQIGDTYHLLYQHAREKIRPWQEPISWGHTTTRDFLNFEELPEAICPGTNGDYDSFGCWSGTAAFKNGTLYVYYAAAFLLPNGDAAQTIGLATSTDGVHFEKHPENPIIDHYPKDGCRDFRDPAILIDGDNAFLVIGSANQERTIGRLLLYKSKDLIHWQYSGILAEWEGCRFCECPSFLRMPDGTYLLSCSVIEAAEEIRHFYLMTGNFDGNRFTPLYRAEPQKGPDQYAGQVFRDEHGRILMLSWIPGWAYAHTFEHCVGCLSLPMEIICDGDTIKAFPATECQHLLSDSDPAIIRTASGFVIHRDQVPDIVYTGPLHDLKALRDEYVLEVFVNGGECVYAVLLQ
ncbi:MAG: glycoside hydrolase family 32 protein [Clostridia bacterium]|nr:glycoside hydrolase family 32 protein [Clostridia bacterium]